MCIIIEHTFYMVVLNFLSRYDYFDAQFIVHYHGEPKGDFVALSRSQIMTASRVAIRSDDGK